MRDARRSSSPPPPQASPGGGTQLKRLRYVKPAGRAQAALPALPAPPSGSHRARGGTRSTGVTRASRPPGRTRTRGEGSTASPSPLPPLPRVGGHFRGHLPPADGGAGGVISQRGGRRPPPRGPRTPPKGGGGGQDQGATVEPHPSLSGAVRKGRRRRWGTRTPLQGGDRRCRLTPIPQGTAPGGRRRRRPLLGRSRTPPPPGAVTGQQGESLPPSPPQKRAQRVGGKRVGQPRRPMHTLCDEHRAPACKSCKGHRGVRHCCSRHHEGHPRVFGGGTTVPAGPEGGAAAAATGGRLALRRSAIVPAPMTKGEGGGPAGQGTAASPRGGTQGPGQGHGRASEEGT